MNRNRQREVKRETKRDRQGHERHGKNKKRDEEVEKDR